jgi:hypothetical protein
VRALRIRFENQKTDMTPESDKSEDGNVRVLANQIYEALSLTGMVSLFEVLAKDIYCQIGEKDSFVFSVEVRGDDAEFFLYDMNFILSAKGGFEMFTKEILDVIHAVIKGDYQVEIIKFGEKVVLSNIIFSPNLKIRLHKSILYPLAKMVSSRLSRHVKKGKAITKPLESSSVSES